MKTIATLFNAADSNAIGASGGGLSPENTAALAQVQVAPETPQTPAKEEKSTETVVFSQVKTDGPPAGALPLPLMPPLPDTKVKPEPIALKLTKKGPNPIMLNRKKAYMALAVCGVIMLGYFLNGFHEAALMQPTTKSYQLHTPLEGGMFSRWGFAADTEKITVITTTGVGEAATSDVKITRDNGQREYRKNPNGNWVETTVR